MHPLIPSTLLTALTSGLTTRDLMRSKPTKRAASKSTGLGKAFNERSKQLAGDNTPVKISFKENVAPSGEELQEMLTSGDKAKVAEGMQALNASQYAGNVSNYSVSPTTGVREFMSSERLPATILTNPNADEIYLAHELGHTASTNTKVGDAIRRIRDYAQANPAAARSMALAAGLTPIAAGAMTPGDDDLDEAILGSIALSSPVLIDEALASKNAIDIMKAAGRPPTMGQYGRLAGGYLSYLAAPIMTATLGNFVGNQLD